jgi:predicted TPR repeat methyltransferase
MAVAKYMDVQLLKMKYKAGKKIYDSRKYEMDLHDGGAEDYEKHISEWVIEHKYFIAGKWGRIFKGLFLDYGCGTGLVSRYLKDHGCEVLGVDISKNMCKIAKKIV